MNRIALGALVLLLSAAAIAQPVGPFTRDANDLLRGRAWSNNMGSNNYFVDACAGDGSTVWDATSLLEHCAIFPAYMQIDKSGTPWEWQVIGYEDLLADFAAAESDITTLLGIVASLESAMATLQDTVATLTSDLNALSTEVDGKFDIPTGTDMECVRGDGSVGVCP